MPLQAKIVTGCELRDACSVNREGAAVESVLLQAFIRQGIGMNR
ncbi:hypothetical protein C7446_1264 [Kushneria sinocarnis]|uniref:Uncharacterized protein n=1 Tax=Kushneria sinocarnis TaxID=595502 RepID=A0A420WYL7_9GAMM|nr:hypothetical protein C7446_1264 [Kushneria sinocarnis]